MMADPTVVNLTAGNQIAAIVGNQIVVAGAEALKTQAAAVQIIAGSKPCHVHR
jgi:hypothetical protein